MAICEFCGRIIPDGSVCKCLRDMFDDNPEFMDENEEKPETEVENETVSADYVRNVLIENRDREFADYERVKAEQLSDYAEQPNYTEQTYSVPVRKKRRVSKKVLLRRRRFAALAIILLLIFGISFIRNNTGCRGTVHDYWKCVVSQNGGKTYYTLGLPQILINHFKDTGEWENLIENYENLSADAVKLKKIRKITKMTKDELHDAEKYLNHIADMYGVEVPSGAIIADSGYFVTVIYKFGDDNVIGGAYYVQIEGEGWKVLPHDMIELN